MKKCNLTIKELKQNVINNMNNCYDKYKDDIMSKFPDEIWEECYEISLTRDLYTYMLYRVNLLRKSELKYLQETDLFDKLKHEYYEGRYRPHHTEYSRLIDNYVKKQQYLEKHGEME